MLNSIKEIFMLFAFLTLFTSGSVYAVKPIDTGVGGSGVLLPRSPTAIAIDQDVSIAFKKLYETTPLAQILRETAKGVLMFPNVIKGGFIIGAQYGKGALRKDGKTIGYFNTVAASYGLQAGIQGFGYVLFFMNDEALAYLDKSSGWEIGVGPSIVIADTGIAKTLSTTTAQDDVYAFIFDQKGLMAGISLQGLKINKINP